MKNQEKKIRLEKRKKKIQHRTLKRKIDNISLSFRLCVSFDNFVSISCNKFVQRQWNFI